MSEKKGNDVVRKEKEVKPMFKKGDIVQGRYTGRKYIILNEDKDSLWDGEFRGWYSCMVIEDNYSKFRSLSLLFQVLRNHQDSLILCDGGG